MIHIILMVVTGSAMLAFMLGADRTENMVNFGRNKIESKLRIF